MIEFAELVAATNYSFLRGASHPSDMVGTANDLGLKAIGIADRNTVAGVVRAFVAHRDAPEKARIEILEAKKECGERPELSEEEEQACKIDVRPVYGARLVFSDGTPDIVAYPRTRKGWGQLTKLLTVGNLRAVKGGCILKFDDLLQYLEDLLLILLPLSTWVEQEAHREDIEYLFDNDDAPSDQPARSLTLVPPSGLEPVLSRLAREAPRRVWLGAFMNRQGRDERQLARWKDIANAAGVPLLATNDALYAGPAQRPLHDVLTCIRGGTTIAKAGKRLEANAERHLKSPKEMARLFRSCPEAIEETMRFISLISFKLTDLSYEYPHEPVPEGWEPEAWLEHLVMDAAYKRYGENLPLEVTKRLDEEFALVRSRRDINYAYYFLTVHDLVKFARSQNPPILCQGRGSAANSIICFLLDVTSIDPSEHDLLFSRFLSDDRKEPPDIDVDFEHERREDVMQYVFKRYGRHRAGIAATVIHYRSRSAVREAAKALGMSEDIPARLADTVWGNYSGDMADRRFADAGLDLDNAEIERLKTIVHQMLKPGMPRHLSQHVGGFVLTQNRLDETVPIHRAAMDDRTFIEWDKDDIDALHLMKVDVLALGMLTCIQKGFDLMRKHGLGDHTLELDLKSDDQLVYDMLCEGDSIGVFQVESRAQINMLPRLRPRTLYDLTIQVAIVRPGPIEGGMVHPYLKRRNGEEDVEYPAPSPPNDPDELRGLLGKTFGVPLFQEQAMKLAITAAGFTSSEANQLRRAMATFRNVGTIHKLYDKMVDGMVNRGYEREFAERCFKQIEGFGSYGFPESHALSFARLVYVSSWIKCYCPAVFACALLNSQPMGFYAPAQIVRDAREHGVTVREIDINASDWDNRLESVGNAIPCPSSRWTWQKDRARDHDLALRLGFRQISGFREEWGNAIADARASVPFGSIEELARRAKLPQRALSLLADADTFRSIQLDRRDALWEVRRTPSEKLPLFAFAEAAELGAEQDAALPAMSLSEHVVTDYQMTRLSLKEHPMTFLRPIFEAEGVLSCKQTSEAKNGATVRTAGIVLVRQRPGKGNAIFVTLEDETGITNILLWARLFETMRRPVMTSRLMLVEGTVQHSKENVVHLMATRVIDRSEELDRLSDMPTSDIRLPRAHHPRNVRILPKSRDFH
jgi:error-prone DNA polymerase